MKKALRSLEKIVWAVNPFEDDSENLRSAAWAMRALARDGGTQVLPVFVWCGDLLDAPFGPGEEFLDKLRARGQETLDSILVRVKIPGIKPLEIVQSGVITLRGQAKALVDFSNQERAKLIVVSSRGRKGLKRLILGSFAETLSLHSDVPLFVVHPGWRRMPEFKQILFPTDFSPESKQAFTKVLDFAETHGSRVLIYHRVTLPTYAAFDFAFPVQTVLEDVLSVEKASMEKEGERLAKQAKERGIRVGVLIDRKTPGSTADIVLKLAKRSGSIVAMASQSGAIATSLLGSTTRSILRQCQNPVWVLHSDAVRAARSKLDDLLSIKNEDIEKDLRLSLSQLAP